MSSPEPPLSPEEDPQASLPDALDPEAHLLCALMFTYPDDERAAWVLEHIEPGDFYNPLYATVFQIIVELQEAGKSFSAPNVNSKLTEKVGAKARLYQQQLVGLATLGSLPEHAIALADDVLGASYRRQFLAMGQSLVYVAEYAAEEDLFDTLVEHGKRQRRAWSRRQAFLKNWKARSKD